MNRREPPQPTLVCTDQAIDLFAADGRYRSIRPLGQGGMAEVVEIEHTGLGKRVVAKILKPHLVHDANMLDRFRFEAQALARIDHPNLVAVLDVGRTTDGRPYFVMEKLVGRTAGDELRARKALPVTQAIDITCQVLAGLGAAHAHGLVHRDVKLDNVFLCETPAGRVAKVLDFGVAKTRRTGEMIARAPDQPTTEGTVMGTPRYIAPEQIRGVPVDARADIYATGMLLYTLLAGRSAFVELTGLPLLRAHLNEPPKPPSHWAPSPLPPELDRAVLRALAKAPDDRYPTAAAFAAELRQIQAEPARALPRSDERASPARDSLLLAALVVGSATGFWLLLALAARLLGWQ